MFGHRSGEKHTTPGGSSPSVDCSGELKAIKIGVTARLLTGSARAFTSEIFKCLHSTYIRNIHQIRKIATIAPAM